jgi:hypothetical protein
MTSGTANVEGDTMSCGSTATSIGASGIAASGETDCDLSALLAQALEASTIAAKMIKRWAVMGMCLS